MTEESKKLTPKQQVFISEYLKSFNATAAALAAGYSEKTAYSIGWENLRKPEIATAIQERLDEVHMSANEAIKLQTDIARGDITEFITPFGNLDIDLLKKSGKGRLVKKFKQKTVTKIGKGEKDEDTEILETELELYDAQAAQRDILKLVNNLLSNNAGDNSQPVTIPAEFLAGAYVDVYRDIISRKYKEFPFGNGRGSIKSTFVGGWMIPYLIANNPQIHGLALRQKAKDLRGSVYTQISWGIGKLGLRDKFKFSVSPLEITYIPTGQKIYFSGADDPGSLKSIKPPFGYVGLLWFEEFDQFRGEEAVRNILQSALRGGDTTWMFETWNTPKSIQSWVNKWELIPKEGRRPVHKASYLDVPKEWLGETFIEEAEHLKLVNPKAYEHEYMGIATGTGGQVFENLEIREITDAEIEQFDNIKDGIDWGFAPDPFVWGKYHYDAKHMTIYVLDEFWANKLRNEEAYNHLVKNGKISPQRLIIADSSEDKSVSDFRAYGANIRGAEKGPGSVKYSYKWLQSRAKIVIDPARAPNHVREFVNCEHEQMKDGTFIGEYPDRDNHTIDTCRYAHNLEWRTRGQ